MTVFTPRPAQLAMLRGLDSSLRHQLVAGMGTGKSGGILVRASNIEWLTGRWPGLVIVAPLQVCFNWMREIPLWRPDLKAVLVAGTMAKREAAVKESADIYVVSYDSLPWLEKYLPGSWTALGTMLAADESTRLRGTRVSVQTSPSGKRFLRRDGGAQTNALAKHAFDFTYWVNATGTPCPNGVQNWWPQIWYIDQGKRLGNSYTAFEQRWFARPAHGGEFAKLEPLPGAIEDIVSRIRDVVTVVKTEDFFDVGKPFVLDRFVDMPASARKAYKDMRTKMVATLPSTKDGVQNSVIAKTAASRVSKLAQIAAGWVYWTDDFIDPDLRNCDVLHTAKLDALESILNETDEPLVVFYQFKASEEMLKQRFKNRLVVLDKGGEAQNAWNAGKVEILACQYQRGGLGLSLQHGGRNLCMYEPTYWADLYEQAIERLGPLRQMQSGYDRTVNVFRICATDSVDVDIYDKVAAKIDLQDFAVELLKGK